MERMAKWAAEGREFKSDDESDGDPERLPDESKPQVLYVYVWGSEPYKNTNVPTVHPHILLIDFSYESDPNLLLF